MELKIVQEQLNGIRYTLGTTNADDIEDVPLFRSRPFPQLICEIPLGRAKVPITIREGSA